jgi:uncharacterized protein YgiM (DUF1202 family)
MLQKILRRTLILSVFGLVFFRPCLAQESPLFIGVVIEDNVNVRADSTVSSQGISTVNKGVKLDIMRDSYDWYKVRLPASSSVFVRQDMLECVQFSDINKGCAKAKVIRENVNARLSPDETAHIVGKLNRDESVTVVNEAKGWSRIRPTRNCFGWINKKFVERAVEPPAKRKR